IITFLFAVGYAQSDWQFIKDTLWTAGGIAADMKYEFSRTTGYVCGFDEHPSTCQQRLINLVNAEARYGGTTDATELFGRALWMGAADNVGATSFNTTANGEIFVFTKTGDVYVFQASSLERVQAGVNTVGQGAATAAVGLQVGNMAVVTTGSTLKTLGSLRHSGTIGSSPLRGAPIIQGEPKLSALSKGNLAAETLTSSTAQPPHVIILRQTARFLKDEGISLSLRREMIEAGFKGTVGADTPATLTRFQEIFAGTERAGKTFGGRLGNVSTRVETIMEAQAMERAGLFPSFEYWTGRNAVDLVGLDAAGNPVRAVQFVRWNRLWPDEIPTSFRITRDLGITVRFVVVEP
ncbi:MAG: hypothetical protein QUV05_13770, partial [Phycisphaerae bacterium]|nr:hypothetical protein [Phycisphaerae bacterium]